MAKDTGMKKQLEVKQFKLPDTMVIIFIIMIFVALLTYIIPAGTYDTIIDAAGEEVVDPNSFHYISRSPVSILEFFKALLNGLKKQSSMILSVIVICSCFRVVNDTKALSNFFTAALNKLQHRAILLIPVILTFGTFGLFVWGAITLDWGQDMMAAMMLMVAIASGFLSGMNGDKIAKSFKNGAKGIIPGMVQVGFATSIGMMMESGNIIHTVVNVIAEPLSHMTPMLAAIIMFLFGCFVLNFVVTSSSGQAAIIMPVLAPLSDVIGLSRQVAVLAYQYGDGMSNVLYPVSSTLIASLGIAGIPYQKWVKFVFPLFMIWCVISIIAIAVAVMIGL